MRTVLIRVDNAPDSGGYAVDLCIDDGTDPAWLDKPLVAVTLPSLPENPAGNPGDVLHSPGVTREALLGIGRYLHRVIHDGPIGATLEQACNGGSKHVMFDVRPAELRCLPWETMALDTEHLLFADPANPYARATLPFAKPSGPVDVPVRMLVLVGDTAEKLCHRQEIDSIQSGLRAAPVRWQVEILEEPSEQAFFDAYDKLKPHVVHFIGHGMLNRADNKPVLLVNIAATGDTWKLSQFHIVNRLRANPPRIVVLNACRTADTPSRNAVSGVAGAFEQLGSGAVISMQGELTSPAAVRFSRVFYERLAPGADVDVAAAAAQARLDVATSAGVNVRDWALASLSLQVAPRHVLDAPLGVSSQSLRTFEKRAGYNKARVFVNRTSERHDLLDSLDPNDSPLTGSDLHVIAGLSKVGKSTLVQCLLHTLHARGHQAVYVDLAGEKQDRQAIGWVPALRHINQVISTWLPETGSVPCKRFVDDLAWLASGAEPQGPGAAALPDGGFAPETERADEFLNRIFGAFRVMLEDVATDKPLIVALDRFTAATPIQYLVDGLLTPVAGDELRGVRLVVVDTKEKVDDVVRDPLRSLANYVELAMFDMGQFERLIREFCALNQRAYDGRWRQITETIVQPSKPWGPGMFEAMEHIVAHAGGGQ